MRCVRGRCARASWLQPAAYGLQPNDSALLPHTTFDGSRIRVSRIRLLDAASDSGGADRSVDFTVGRALDDPRALDESDRSIRARGRTQVASPEGGHADHGWHLDPRRNVRGHVAVGRSDESLRVDRTADDDRLWAHRLLG